MRKILRALFMMVTGLSGCTLLAIAILASRLGLDKDQTWGTQRMILAGLGLLLMLYYLLVFHYNNLEILWKKLLKKIERPPSHDFFGRSSSPAFALMLGGCVVAVIIAWSCITQGTFTSWGPSTRYFDRLADAFLHGSFALLESPPAELLALENPYDWTAREGISYLWDASVYEGRYYLYFGPLPALVAVPFKWLFRDMAIEDQFILMAFFIGFCASLGALLFWLRKHIFSLSPAWIAAGLFLLGSLNLPTLWLVQAHYVYEASIMGGQFFLVLGTYAALRGVSQSGKSQAWLALAGTCWGAAIGCRMNHVVGVAMMCALTGVFIVGQKRQSAPRLMWLVIPLFLWGLWLGYYNLARFGSLLEFGHRYQLTGPAYSDQISDIFSLRYVLPNTYNMLLRPPLVNLRQYPYVSAPFIDQDMWPWFIRPPAKYYYSEAIVGLLPGVPALALLLTIPVHAAVRLAGWLNGLPGSNVNTDKRDCCLRQSRSIILAGLAGGAATIALYVASTMRYLADIAPLAILLLALVVWRGWERTRNFPLLQALWLSLFALMAGASIVASLWINRPG